MRKAVKITWEESRQMPRWQHVEDIDEDVCICETIGWLVKESEMAYYVSSTIADDGEQACQIIIIPKSCVKEYQELTEAIKP